MNIVFIGAGNLATSLAKEMYRHDLRITQIYSRTVESASTLANEVNCAYTNRMEEVRTDADLYVFSVKDSALEDLIGRLRPNKGLWAHTAGSMPARVFEGYADRYGVIYPLQTFNKQRQVDFTRIPFIIEANTPEDETIIKDLASLLSRDVRVLSSEERKKIHLAAVFACNFANHMWHIAWQLLEEKQISPDILRPLIEETAAKIKDMSPAEAQTGPAIRYDKNVIDKHLSMLKEDDIKTIYRMLSQSIYKMNEDKR